MKVYFLSCGTLSCQVMAIVNHQYSPTDNLIALHLSLLTCDVLGMKLEYRVLVWSFLYESTTHTKIPFIDTQSYLK